MAKIFSYNPTGAGYYNRVEMSGGTESDPITFDDLVAADRAGTLKLLDGLIDADPDTFSLDFQVQPVELRALQLTIACTARAGATADIAGKDAWGNAITENGIDISSGSATTTEYFSEVDANGITVNGLQNGDEFDIEQNQWGVIWNYSGDDTYLSDVSLWIGDSTTPTYFKDINKNIVFRDGIGTMTIISVKNLAIFQLGEVDDEATKATKNGCTIHIMNVYSSASIICSHYFGSALLFYDCFISSPHLKTTISLYNGRMWNCQLSRKVPIMVWLLGEDSAVDISRLTSNRGEDATLLKLIGTPIVNDAKLDGGDYGIDMSNYDATARNLYIARQYYAAIYIHVGVGGYTKSLKLIDTFIDVWKIQGMKSCPGEVLRQYSCNIRVADKNGVDLSGATVTCKDKDDNTVFSVQTDVEGNIAEQIITYQRWNDPEGNYPTYYAYEEDAECSSPHKFIMSKTGYETLELEEIVVDNSINWHFELQDPVVECDYPSEDDVEKDVNYDSGNKIGNFEAPQENEVKKNVGYGAQGVEFTGTLEAGAILIGNNLKAQLQKEANLVGTLQKKTNMTAVFQKEASMTGKLVKKVNIAGTLRKTTNLEGELK